MNSPTYDVVVIGAGPAGSTAARRAARDGASVLLLDKARFPRPKVCGCCVNRAALAGLEQLGLGELCQSLRANPVNHLRLWSGGCHALISLPGAVAISRAAFDAQLAQAAVDAGARFMDGTAAHVVEPRRVKIRTDTSDTTIEAGIVVGADGLAGRSLADGMTAKSSRRIRPGSRMGFGTRVGGVGLDIEPGVIEMACGRAGYVGQVRLEDGSLDIAGAMDPSAVREAGGPGPAAERLLEAAGLAVSKELAHAKWTGTSHLTRRRLRPASDGVLIVGDSAGYVEPFTGEGMAWAIRGGMEAGRIAAQAARDPDHRSRYETRWVKRHAGLIRRRQIPCRLTAAALRRPRFTHALVRTLSHHPGLAGPIVQRITGPITTPESQIAKSPGERAKE